jgi:hypothetical protein
MRSGIGAFCPLSRRDLLLDELFLGLPDFAVATPLVVACAAVALLAALL